MTGFVALQSLTKTLLFILIIPLVCWSSVQTFGLYFFMMGFVFQLDMFHTFIKTFTGRAKTFAVLYVPEHEVIQELVKMVLHLPA